MYTFQHVHNKCQDFNINLKLYITQFLYFKSQYRIQRFASDVAHVWSEDGSERPKRLEKTV